MYGMLFKSTIFRCRSNFGFMRLLVCVYTRSKGVLLCGSWALRWSSVVVQRAPAGSPFARRPWPALTALTKCRLHLWLGARCRRFLSMDICGTKYGNDVLAGGVLVWERAEIPVLK